MKKNLNFDKKTKFLKWLAGGVCLSIVSLCSALWIERADAEEVEQTKVIQVDDCLELGNIVSDRWEDDYFGLMVFDTDSERLEVDGRETTFSEQFGIENPGAGEQLETCDDVEEFLEEQNGDTIYEVAGNGKTVKITAPYQTKRLIVESAYLDGFYGAETAYCNKEMNETYLQFTSEEAAKEACERISTRYGENFCFADEIFCVDDVSVNDEDADAVYSWGASYMGMDSLKTQAKSKPGLSTVKVAVIDTGIDASNFMFSNRTITDDSYNIEAGNYNVKDDNGHGTHVSGTIVDATPDNVQIMSLKVANNVTFHTVAKN